MKKLLLAALLVGCGSSLIAQNWYLRPTVGYTLPVINVDFPQVNNAKPEDDHAGDANTTLRRSEFFYAKIFLPLPMYWPRYFF